MALTLLGTGLALGLWGLLTLGVFVNNEPLDNPLGLLLMPFLWPFSVSRGGVVIVSISVGAAGLTLTLLDGLAGRISNRHAAKN